MFFLFLQNLNAIMFNFYQYLSTLSFWELFYIALPIVSLLILMPYFGHIFKVLRILIRFERLEILQFEIFYTPVYSEKDSQLFGTSSDYFLSGTTATLYWRIKGASRVDLYPIGRNLKGNSANIIIENDNRDYTLTIYGLFGKKSSTISIPAESIKKIETEKISENESGFELSYSVDTTSLEPEEKKFITDGIENYSKLKQKQITPNNTRLIEVNKKESSFFRMNYSLSKYNKIIANQKNNNNAI